MADFLLLEDDKKPEESTATSEHDETSQEAHNGDKTENEEDKADDDKQDGKERSRKGNRFHPYKDKQDRKAGQRNRVFISNIPYDMKWQAIKDLMREKVGEVTYVELFKDAEGKSRVSDVAQAGFYSTVILLGPFWSYVTELELL
ncbi:hypothetical protein NQD34_001428 [Periophthalmus magnuspinnatus]|nr:hypothetical protein NQD34_001428 [Periophthalmus magnuspinnatus]